MRRGKVGETDTLRRTYNHAPRCPPGAAESRARHRAQRFMWRRPAASCVSVVRLPPLTRSTTQSTLQRRTPCSVRAGDREGLSWRDSQGPHGVSVSGGAEWRQAGHAHWSTSSPRMCRSPCPTSTARPVASTARCSPRQWPGTQACSGASRQSPPSPFRESPPLCPARYRYGR